MTELWFRLLVSAMALGSICGLMLWLARSLSREVLPTYCPHCQRDHFTGECEQEWNPKEAA